MLASGAIVDLPPPIEDGDDIDQGGSETCHRCGSREFESRLPGKRFAILSWLLIGFPLASPVRKRFCRKCGAPAAD